MIGIPADATPGTHTITLSDGTGRITIQILRMVGSLDATRLWTGNATTMRLRVEGTTERFPFKVVNQSPAVIEIDGGEVQVVHTEGGADNVVTRGVRGIHRGEFSIVYSVDEPTCGMPGR
jgi:hypothetical protein